MLNENKRFIPSLEDFQNDFKSKENFDDLLKENEVSNNIVNGDIVKGTIINIDRDKSLATVYVAGLKNEVQLSFADLCLVQNPNSKNSDINGEENLKTDLGITVGLEMDFLVERIESRKGVLLSRRKILASQSWQALEEKYKNNEFVEGVIFSKIKGGFTVMINEIVAFLPGSQVDVRPVSDLDSIMNISQQFQILKMDKKLSNIIVSRKAVIEDARSEEKEKLLSEIEEGSKLRGVVKNITDYGAFIDLGSIDGLLHVTDISWARINHPSEVLKIGQEIDVMVIQYDRELKKLSLGMKQLEEDPWSNIKKEFTLNQPMKGKIVNIADYGVFIELKKGIEGLVHLSEISWNKNNYSHKKSFQIGQEASFVIIAIDAQKHRISLSMKRCYPNPLMEFAKNNPVGTVIKAPVRNITDFGIFVAINDTQDAMIHESDISWENNGQELIKNYKKGDEIECKVLSIDIDSSRVTLGIKQLVEAPKKPINHFKKNMLVTCVVKYVKHDSIDVTVEDQGFKVQGFIKEQDLGYSKYDQTVKRFRTDDRFDAKIIAFKGNKLMLSIKLLEQETRAKVIKEYGSTTSGASLEGIIGAAFKEKEAVENTKDKESQNSQPAKSSKIDKSNDQNITHSSTIKNKDQNDDTNNAPNDTTTSDKANLENDVKET